VLLSLIFGGWQQDKMLLTVSTQQPCHAHAFTIFLHVVLIFCHDAATIGNAADFVLTQHRARMKQ
jgi:hypothetical protein